MGQRNPIGAERSGGVKLLSIEHVKGLSGPARKILADLDGRLRDCLLLADFEARSSIVDPEAISAARVSVLMTIVADFGLDLAQVDADGSILDELQDALRDAHSWSIKKRSASLASAEIGTPVQKAPL